jgi:hypothetical protein
MAGAAAVWGTVPVSTPDSPRMPVQFRFGNRVRRACCVRACLLLPSAAHREYSWSTPEFVRAKRVLPQHRECA